MLNHAEPLSTDFCAMLPPTVLASAAPAWRRRSERSGQERSRGYDFDGRPGPQPLTIGVLDSGVGGLTVVKQLLRALPSASIRYLGDNARCPYGVRAPEEIRHFTWQLIAYLSRQPLDALVIACNTATAVVLEEAQQQLPFPVLGVILPGVEAALRQPRVRKVALLATPATVRAGVHAQALRAHRPEIEVMSLACPDFVTLVETGRHTSREALLAIDALLAPVRDFGPDALILGCTHFPLLKDAIQAAVGAQVLLIDPAEATAQELKARLAPTGYWPSPLLNPTRHTFYTTGPCHTFRRIGEHWLERNIRVRGCKLASADNQVSALVPRFTPPTPQPVQRA